MESLGWVHATFNVMLGMASDNSGKSRAVILLHLTTNEFPIATSMSQHLASTRTNHELEDHFERIR